MNKTVKETIHAKGIDIGIYTTDFKNEYISLTDIARYRSSDPRITIHTWLRGRDIVEFLGLWESLHNPDFKRSEFDTFKKDTAINQLKTILGLDFSSQKILSISDTSGEEK